MFIKYAFEIVLENFCEHQQQTCCSNSLIPEKEKILWKQTTWKAWKLQVVDENMVLCAIPYQLSGWSSLFQQKKKHFFRFDVNLTIAEVKMWYNYKWA
jgi:hypothetical protein